jgi:aryl-alcohol dehydrogenase-like predicted oxidoreductase
VHPVSAVQVEYSLFAREPEDELLPTCRELGVGLVAYSPLGRGFLTGAITSLDDLAPDDFRRHSPRFAEEALEAGDSRAAGRFPRFQGEALEANLALVARVREIAATKGCTPGQLALAWVLAQGPRHGLGVAPIPGTKRVRYLEENVGALGVELTAVDLEALEQAVPRDAVVGARYGDMSSIDA